MPRRLTDRSLPPGLSAISPDASLFDDLLETEKRLDWTMTRRRQEIYDTLSRSNGGIQTKRTLRIFMSHSVKNQAWQKGSSEDSAKAETAETTEGEKQEGEEPKTRLETGDGVPSWTFKVEGKLLHPDDMPKPKRWPTPQRRFSHLVRSLAIEMDRDPTVYADTNHVQWNADPRWANYNLLGAYPTAPASTEPAGSSTSPPTGATPLDGFTITRTGDVPIMLRITLNINHIPDRIKLSPQLASILGIQEDIKANILGAFWHYVKANGLQDKNDRKLIRLDDRLKSVFKYESLNFQDIQALLTAHMQPADPVILQYEIGTHRLDSAGQDMDMDDPSNPVKISSGGIGVNEDGQSAIKAFDVELDMDDLWMRMKAADTIMSMQPDPVQIGTGTPAPPSATFLAIQKADDEIKHNLQTLRSMRVRRDFFAALAAKPSSFIQNFVESQARDLEVILGNERAAEGGGAGGNAGGIRESDLTNSEFFQGDWAAEAVAVHEGMRMGAAVASMHHAQQAQNMQGMGGMGGMGPPGMQMGMR